MTGLVDRERQFFDEHWISQSDLGKPDVPFQIPGVPELSGLRVLVCSCGTGLEPVQAARAGADVYTFDISPVAVRQTRERASQTGVKVVADVMDFHALSYADGFFDVVYGSAILHHVECEQVGREVLRVLKPGGVAFFWENSDRNPLLRWCRRLVFGSPGGVQRQRVLFLRRKGTTDEYPLTEDEVQMLARIFSGNLTRVYRRFEFFRMVAYVAADKGSYVARVLDAMDAAVVKLFPRAMQYSFHQGLLLRKPSRLR